MIRTALYAMGIICLAACTSRQAQNTEHLWHDPIDSIPVYHNADTLFLDADRSTILWGASEMRGAIRRKGKIDFKNGFVLVEKNSLVAGAFVVDMHSMQVTDVPIHEVIARRNLVNHLKSDDFFAVDSFPESYFTISAIVSAEDSNYEALGELTIRAIAHPVVVQIQASGTGFTARLDFDRFLWDIAYTGSWAQRTLVDREISLNIDMVIAAD